MKVEGAPADKPMLRQLATEIDSIYFEQRPSYRDLIAVLVRSRFQISGRNHNPVLGALVGFPAISYGTTSHKVNGISELLGFDTPYDGAVLRSNIDAIRADADRHPATERRSATRSSRIRRGWPSARWKWGSCLEPRVCRPSAVSEDRIRSSSREVGETCR